MIENIQQYMVEGFLLLALIVFSWINIKKKEFPSVLTTAVLFVVIIAKLPNLQFGILAFVLGWFLMEFQFFEGIADLKIITMIGLTISSLGFFFLFAILTLVLGTVYKVLLLKVIKKKKTEEIAFVPVFLLVYIAILIMQFI